jgi:predicted amidohydrolase
MLRIALVQLRCEKGALADNLVAHAAQITAAEARGVDVICFPEMSLTGYANPTRQPETALRLEGAEVAAFVELTRGRGLTAIAGIIEQRHNAKPFITQLVAHGGQLLGVYRKITIAPDEVASFSPGSDAPVFEHAGMRFGLAICADIDNPDVFARAAQRGARIVFHPSAPGMYGDQATRDWRAGFEWWRDGCREKLGQHARMHSIFIATATQAGRTLDEDFPGGGYVFGPRGECVAQTLDWSEGVLDAEIADL